MALKGTKKPTSVKWAPTLEERLARMKIAYEFGVLWGLNDALNLFSQFGGTLPDWALQGAIKVLQERLQKGPPVAKGGPAANDIAKKRQDMKHFSRWRVVKQLMKPGMSETSAFKAALPSLAAKSEEVSWQAVRDSYHKVEADWLNPIERHKYYLPMFDWGLASD